MIVIAMFTIQPFSSWGQSSKLTDEELNNSGVSSLMFAAGTERARELSRADIEKGKPFLILQGGIAPVVHAKDSLFENKFGVYYYEQGCLSPGNEILEAYNFVIFEYLDEQYGKKWRKSVRRDVIGFKMWKRKNN